jgi:hypothetical protein
MADKPGRSLARVAPQPGRKCLHCSVNFPVGWEVLFEEVLFEDGLGKRDVDAAHSPLTRRRLRHLAPR